jgi:predicted AlkP superfamily pyrophosphatase or phosphodiesterase
MEFMTRWRSGSRRYHRAMLGIARQTRPFCFELACALIAALAFGCSGDSVSREASQLAARAAEEVPAREHAVRSADEPSVILLSLDGVRHDYLERDDLPAFARLMKQGAVAKRLLPVFPSITFPSHVSIATGTHPDVHGIVANHFWDSARGEEYDYSAEANWLNAEPLWITAERQGIPAAVFFWVGSETDWRGARATHRKSPFDSKTPESEKVDQILAWLDIPTSNPTRPGLVMAYWHGADHAGHRNGPGSSAVGEALREQDRQLGRLLAGLDERDAWRTTTLLVVSDHGMIEAGDAVDVRELLSDAGIGARTIQANAVAHIRLNDRAEMPGAVETLSAHPSVRAFAAADVPSELRYSHPSRTGDIVALATPPFVFRGASQSLGAGMLKAAGNRPGTHGYSVDDVPEMAGIFLAAGRGVAPGRTLGDVRAIDVAASVAQLLGIDAPAQSEGRPIEFAAP